MDWHDALSTGLGSSLEQIHIFALAHILRRPVIVYGIKFVKSFRGENLGFARFQGTVHSCMYAVHVLFEGTVHSYMCAVLSRTSFVCFYVPSCTSASHLYSSNERRSNVAFCELYNYQRVERILTCSAPQLYFILDIVLANNVCSLLLVTDAVLLLLNFGLPCQLAGVYLPLLWEQSFCFKTPITLGYTRGHFSALVAMEVDMLGCVGAGATVENSGEEQIAYLPLTDYEGKPLSIHFLPPGEVHDVLVRDCCG